MELGLITFADMEPESLPGRAINAHQRIKDLMEEIKLADQLGLDVFGVGEHHRPDYAVSSPSVILGAAAMITKNIRLSSAVTVLSSDDPIRIFRQLIFYPPVVRRSWQEEVLSLNHSLYLATT